MGLNRAGFRRFMERADATLRDLFPCTLVIAGTSYEAAGVGGAGLSEYFEGGEAPQGARHFRISKSQLGTRPAEGTLVEWPGATGGVTLFRVMECPDRPHETSWTIRCEPDQR